MCMFWSLNQDWNEIITSVYLCLLWFSCTDMFNVIKHLLTLYAHQCLSCLTKGPTTFLTSFFFIQTFCTVYLLRSLRLWRALRRLYLDEFSELRRPLGRVERLSAGLADSVEDGHDRTDGRAGVNVERSAAGLQLVGRDAERPPAKQ